MAKAITYKSRLEQIKPRLWQLIDNELFLLDSGRVVIAPRMLKTDNNTNPFGDNDISDVRASHIHDLGCRYHSLIYVNLSLDELIEKGLLRLKSKSGQNSYCDIWVCEDIPINYLSVERVTFSEINSIFKQILLACNTGKCLTYVMRFAVNFNIGWLFSGKKPLDLNKLYIDFI